jgi:AraC family transcriptional regulator of adaptative response / DNA-3-methyladenine glycosylase II
MELLDRSTYYRAFQSHDARFDGRVFVGVTSTGIYCRPVCPARTPRFENCRFFASAAAAQEAGFRPCLRCRPEIAPDFASWRGSANTVSRALALIADGALDEDEAGVEALAERLGVGGRQLRRLFQRHLGASPIAVAQTRRVLFAKQLLHDTRLPMAEVALASGFGSVRRFNETFRKLFDRPPRHATESLSGSPTARLTTGPACWRRCPLVNRPATSGSKPAYGIAALISTVRRAASPSRICRTATPWRSPSASRR